MTDNDIIEAIEYCSSHDDCDLKCPIGKETTADEGCIRTIGRLALDIINRQKVEIDILIRKKETLKDEVSELKAEVERLQKANESFSCLGMLYSEIKSEARKEFWEQIKAMYGLDENDIIVAVNIKEIDNLLAEMESEGK